MYACWISHVIWNRRAGGGSGRRSQEGDSNGWRVPLWNGAGHDAVSQSDSFCQAELGSICWVTSSHSQRWGLLRSCPCTNVARTITTWHSSSSLPPPTPHLSMCWGWLAKCTMHPDCLTTGCRLDNPTKVKPGEQTFWISHNSSHKLAPEGKKKTQYLFLFTWGKNKQEVTFTA